MTSANYAGSWSMPPTYATEAVAGPHGAAGGPRASAERALAVSGPLARAEVLRALRIAGFRIDTEQLSLIVASRGSTLGAALQQSAKLALSATVRIAETSTGCLLSVELSDRTTGGLGRLMGAAGAYRTAFEAVLTALDAALLRTDPSARGTFAPPSFSSPAVTPHTPKAAWAGSGMYERAREILDGAPLGPASRSWRGVGGASIVSPKGVAILDVAALQMMATVGTQVVCNPGAVPVELAARVRELVATLDQRLSAPGVSSGLVAISVRDDQTSVVEFLRQQARIREQLPLRLLQRCSTCRLEKVVNPDYKKLMNRNRKIKTLSGSFGGIVSSAGISPIVLVGKLVQAKQFDPDYVCPRCQGMQAESTMMTFCPNCGNRRDESTLRTCAGCSYDFRKDLPAEELWQPPQAQYGPYTAPAMPATTAGWYPDHTGAPQLRWWDGSSWTEHVHRDETATEVLR